MGSIREKVEQLINKHGTNNPFKIAKKLNIMIRYEPLGSTLGYYSRTHRTKVIHINESLSYEKQLSTCAHELGHSIFHPDSNSAFLKANTYYPESKIEQEANEFMVELLSHQGNDASITIKEAVENYNICEQFLKKNF